MSDLIREKLIELKRRRDELKQKTERYDIEQFTLKILINRVK